MKRLIKQNWEEKKKFKQFSYSSFKLICIKKTENFMIFPSSIYSVCQIDAENLKNHINDIRCGSKKCFYCWEMTIAQLVGHSIHFSLIFLCSHYCNFKFYFWDVELFNLSDLLIQIFNYNLFWLVRFDAVMFNLNKWLNLIVRVV